MTNYTQEQYEQDKQILDNAPKLSTHVDSFDGEVYYWNLAEGSEYRPVMLTKSDDDEPDQNPTNTLKSLSGIRDKVELYERLRKLESACLSDDVLEFVKCGIGGNYGGEFYIEKLEQVYEPLLKLKQTKELTQ